MSARETLVASITGLIQRRGVAGAGLSALLEDSGVARRTVYLNFPGGKAELVTEATRIAGQALSAVIRSADKGDDPIQAVRTFIDQWKAQLRATEMEAGCPIVAAILGRSEAPAAAQAAAEAVDDWRTILADRWSAPALTRKRPLTGDVAVAAIEAQSSLRLPVDPRMRSTPSAVTSSKSSNCIYRRVVPPLGLEPRTCGLKVRSSTN